jgi:hypothetical protein
VHDAQAAVYGSSANGSDTLTAAFSRVQLDAEPVFDQLRALLVTVGGAAATVLAGVQRLHASMVAGLRLCLCCAGVAMSSSPEALLRTLAAHFTELRRLSFVLMHFRSAEQLPTAVDVLSLRALRSLRDLCLQRPFVRGAPLRDAALLDMLQCMPNMRDLPLIFRSGRSSRAVPAIGTVCPLLEQLQLEMPLDVDSFNDHAAKSPCLRHLVLLRVQGLTQVDSIST